MRIDDERCLSLLGSVSFSVFSMSKTLFSLVTNMKDGALATTRRLEVDTRGRSAFLRPGVAVGGYSCIWKWLILYKSMHSRQSRFSNVHSRALLFYNAKCLAHK